MGLRVAVLGVLLLALACAPASDPAARCVPGAVAICPCLGGGSGVQTCLADGTFAPCTCVPDAEPDVTVDTGGSDSAISDTVDDSGVVETSADAPSEGGDATSAGVVSATPPKASCGAVVCSAASKNCAAKGCVAIDDPLYGCGSTTCTPCGGSNATLKCTSGACAIAACHTGWADCDGSAANGCESDLSLPTSCGSCGVVCGAGKVCTPTGCASSCPAPLTDCGGACVNLSTTLSHCGSCSRSCAAAAITEAPTCVAGVCGTTCAPGYTMCAGTCVDLLRDNAHCGKCGQACSTKGETCTAGSCPACPTGMTLCPKGCFDLRFATTNCGACDNYCTPSDTMVCDGKCGDPALYTAPGAMDVAVDDEYVYWVTPTAGTVSRAPKRYTGTIVVLAKDQLSPSRLLIDATHLYWSNTSGAAVMRMPKAGGTVATVAAAKEPTKLALDDTKVYWLNNADKTIASAPKAGGVPTVLVTISGTPHGPAVGGGLLFYSDAVGLHRMSTAGGPSTLLIPLLSKTVATAVGGDGNYACIGLSAGSSWYECIDLATSVIYRGVTDLFRPFTQLLVTGDAAYAARAPSSHINSIPLCASGTAPGIQETGPINGFTLDARFAYIAGGGQIKRVNLRLP